MKTKVIKTILGYFAGMRGSTGKCFGISGENRVEGPRGEYIEFSRLQAQPLYENDANDVTEMLKTIPALRIGGIELIDPDEALRREQDIN